jgi:o-succinylbenzoate synthase
VEPAVTLRVSLQDTQRALTRPAQNARQSWAERQATIITLESDDGVRGRGEASPLPGFSPDRLEDCTAALRTLDLAEIPARIAPGQSVVRELARASARLPAGLPAARAALEAALLDLWARGAGVPAWALLAETQTRPQSRAVCALLMGEPEQALEQAERAHARGVRSFKFKIGRPQALDRELLAVAQLRRTLGPALGIRLDANQSLSVATAQSALPRFAEQQLEFIEEPCAPRELSLLRELGLPIACDESLSSGELPDLPLCALILKPTLLGGASACAAFAARAAQLGAQVVLSHAFEGPLGLALSATLALCFGSKQFAHGLDLEGARLAASELPCFSGALIEPWSEPGFGLEVAQ